MGWPKHGQASAWHWLVLGPGLGRPWLALVGPRAWLLLPLLALTGLGFAAPQGEEAVVKYEAYQSLCKSPDSKCSSWSRQAIGNWTSPHHRQEALPVMNCPEQQGVRELLSHFLQWGLGGG